MTLFQHVHRICFELSNVCNYAHCHAKCPANQHDGSPRILKSEIVEAVITSALQNGFRGWVSFHVYNEPLIDPRLFEFLALAYASDMKPFILTNGWYLDQYMLDALKEAGAAKVGVTVYSEAEFARIRKLVFEPMDHSLVHTKHLDNRMKIYDAPEIEPRFHAPCSQPLGELMIRHTGQVGLCCNDWEIRNDFGDLNEDSIEDVLTSRGMEDLMWSLEKQHRERGICRRCKGGRCAATIARGE